MSKTYRVRSVWADGTRTDEGEYRAHMPMAAARRMAKRIASLGMINYVMRLGERPIDGVPVRKRGLTIYEYEVMGTSGLTFRVEVQEVR